MSQMLINQVEGTYNIRAWQLLRKAIKIIINNKTDSSNSVVKARISKRKVAKGSKNHLRQLANKKVPMVISNNKIIMVKIRAQITTIIREKIEIREIAVIATATAKVVTEAPMVVRMPEAQIITIVGVVTGSSAAIEIRILRLSTTRRRRKAG